MKKKKISRKKSKQVKVKVWDIGVFSQKYQIQDNSDCENTCIPYLQPSTRKQEVKTFLSVIYLKMEGTGKNGNKGSKHYTTHSAVASPAYP